MALYPAANLIIVDRIQLLETALNTVVEFEANTHTKTVAVFTDPRLLCRNHRRSLVHLSYKRFDCIVFPFFGTIRVWEKSSRWSTSKPIGLGLFPSLNLFLSLVRGRVIGWDFSRALKQFVSTEVKILFDVLSKWNPLMEVFSSKKTFIGISHFKSGFPSSGIAAETVELFESNIEKIKGLSTSTDDLQLFLHAPLVGQLQIGNDRLLKLTKIPNLSRKWVEFVRAHSKTLSGKKSRIVNDGEFILLISRPSTKSTGQTHSPHPDIKKQMLKELRAQILTAEKTPVIMPHPTERPKLLHKINWIYAPGWEVIEDVHYILLVEKAHKVVTFGSQLADDCYELGKKAIEYRLDWQGQESRVSLEGRADFCNNISQLAKALRN